MKRLLFAAASVASICLASPLLASAQDYPPTPPTTAAMPGHDIPGQLDSLRQRVQSGFQQGQLSQGETDRLYREIDKIRAIEHSDRDSDGRLRDHDRTDLQARIDDLSRSIHWRREVGGAPPPPAAPPPPTDMATAAPSGPWSLDQREQWLQDRIDRGIDRGWISGREAERGRQELSAIRTQQASLLQRDGGALSPEDRSYLVHRIDELNQTLKWTGANPPPPWMGS